MSASIYGRNYIDAATSAATDFKKRIMVPHPRRVASTRLSIRVASFVENRNERWSPDPSIRSFSTLRHHFRSGASGLLGPKTWITSGPHQRTKFNLLLSTAVWQR